MAASSSRPQKLAKLQQFKANLPHHSQTSLHAMIAEAKKTGLPDYSSPKEQRDARRFLLNQCDGGAMGPVIQEISVQNSEVEPITLPATNFLTYLQALFFRGGSFHQLLASKHKQHPSSTQQTMVFSCIPRRVGPWKCVGQGREEELGMVCQFPTIWPAPPLHRQLAHHSFGQIKQCISCGGWCWPSHHCSA